MGTRILAGLVVALFPIAVAAQETLDSSMSSLPGAHDVARNAQTGGFLVAWGSLDEQHYIRIRARALSPSGKPIGAMIEVDKASRQTTEVSVAYGDGKYLVVWRDGRDSGSLGDEVYAKRLDAVGNPLGSSFRISDRGGIGPDGYADVAYDGKAWMVVWAHREVPPAGGGFTKSFVENDDVCGRRVQTDGTMPAGSFVFTDEAVDSTRPVVGCLASGERFAVWEDHPGPGKPGQVWGTRAGDGGQLGVLVPYGTGGGISQQAPLIAPDTNSGTFVIAWTARVTRLGEEYTYVYARVLAPDGKYVTDRVKIAGIDSKVRGLSLAYDEARKEILLSWDTGIQATADHIRALRLDAKTLAVKGALQLTSGTARHWGIVSDPNGADIPLSAFLRSEKDGEAVELVAGRVASAVQGQSEVGGGGGGGCSGSVSATVPVFFAIALIAFGLLVLVVAGAGAGRNRA